VSGLLEEFARVERLRYYEQDDIRALVISGEPSADGIATLERIARKAVGTQHVEYVSEIDALEVAAYGAAEIARLTQREPETYIPDGNMGRVWEHDEL
jgi:hypothetical protein